MDHNPYTPPQANTETSIPHEAVPRPVAVWLLIVLLLLFALMFVATTARLVGAIAGHGGATRVAVPLAVSLVWNLALVATFLAAALGAYRRRRWSRWFGVALLAAFAAVVIFGADTTRYDNDAERAGGQVGRLILPLLLAWWIYVLAFSSKAKRYFSRTPSVVP